VRFAAEVDPIRGMEIQRDLLYKFSSRHGYFNGLFEKYGIYNEFNVSYNEVRCGNISNQNSVQGFTIHSKKKEDTE